MLRAANCLLTDAPCMPQLWVRIRNNFSEITYKDFNNDLMFEFNDGGNLFPKNFQLKTDSMEVIITHLIEREITPTEDGQKK